MRSLLVPALLVLCSCTLGLAAAPAAPPRTATADVAQGRAFAQAHCSGCHAVTALEISPNPEAPPFETIVNQPGLTEATLRTFLRDSHNFPDIMAFAIDPRQIEALAAYMLTLRQEGE